MDKKELIQISNHAYERYVERVMGYKEKQDIVKYVNENKERLTSFINKLFEYSEHIYYGKYIKNNTYENIYVKDCWILIMDKKNTKLITLYSVDFGLGSDFDNDYISKCIFKIKELQNEYNCMKEKTIEESNKYEDEIKHNEKKIKELTTIIDKLKENNNALKILKSNSMYKYCEKEKQIQEFVNKMLLDKRY